MFLENVSAEQSESPEGFEAKFSICPDARAVLLSVFFFFLPVNWIILVAMNLYHVF